MKELIKKTVESVKKAAMHQEQGLDGILVTIGLCIIALVLCVLMRDAMGGFLTTIVTNMTEKANQILQSTVQAAQILL